MSIELETLLHELRSLGDPIPQSKVFAVLRSFKGQRVYFARSTLERPEQVRLARSMLASGMVRSDVVCALVERLQVSEATARRIVNQALDEARPAMVQLEMLR